MKDFLNDYDVVTDRAVILGKGPSFEKWEEEKDDFGLDWLICGINQVGNATEVDLSICAHIEPALQLRKQKMLVMPYKPIYGWDSRSDHFLGDYKDLNQPLYGYNVYWQGPTRYSSSDVIGGEGTTAHSLVELLARKGVKEFVFFGVDGGKKVYGKKYYASGFDHDSKQYFEKGKLPTDFDQFFSYFFRLRRKYGLRFTWI